MSDIPIGTYTVLGTLGNGAHSSILHIRRAADGANYALKVVQLDTAADQKFFDQAKNEFIIGQLRAAGAYCPKTRLTLKLPDSSSATGRPSGRGNEFQRDPLCEEPAQ